ncbi:MAG: DUF433 domain-containing protein [Fimbriimonadaceae bacterium]
MNTVLLDGAVTRDDGILGGIPVFTGSRVPIENLFDFLSGGYDLNRFLETFPRVKPEYARRVLAESSEALISAIGARAA